MCEVAHVHVHACRPSDLALLYPVHVQNVYILGAKCQNAAKINVGRFVLQKCLAHLSLK